MLLGICFLVYFLKKKKINIHLLFFFKEIAEFWRSRVLKDEQSGYYVINDVQCPDESSSHVNNSIYTNAVAARSLQIATNFGKLLGKKINPQWMEIAQNLKYPFDSKRQIHLQYDGYHGHTINQADVVLLQYPLRFPMDKQIAQNDILYYENVTAFNGFFTGDATYSIANLRLGNYDNAQQFWNNGFLHIKPPFNVWTEKVVGGVNHFITGAGGFLQNVLYGFSAIEVNERNFTINNPVLPPDKGVTFVKIRKLVYLGAKISFTYDSSSIFIIREDSSDTPSLFVQQKSNPSNSYPLTPNKELTFKIPDIFTVFSK